MKTYFRVTLTLLALTLTTAAKAWDVPMGERLTYDVTYKWGLVQKKAGDVLITTAPSKTDPKLYNARLTAKTAPWADKFYVLRDTLRGSIETDTLLPHMYERMAHEGGSYEHDLINYTRTPQITTGEARLWRRRKKETSITESTRTHNATGTTLDMLSAFYYMRRLDFPMMHKGQEIKLNIFSGKRIEILTIHYQGITQVEVGKKKYRAYHVTFTFTTEGGKVSSDNMDAWIYDGPSRVPLLMEGKLPVGKVRAIFTGKP